MIEADAFLGALALQILVVSAFQPVWLTRYVHAKADAQLPGWDRGSRERLLALYRALNAAIALLGLALLGWLFSHIRGPNWDFRQVTLLLCGYAVVQTVPLVLLSCIGAWGKKQALTRSPADAKRTATLQRRGLFDFVSPLLVWLAVAGYFLFAALVIHVQQNGPPRLPGYTALLGVTLIYALNAFCVYYLLYRRKKWPLETSAYRLRAVGVQVKIIVYTSIAVVVFVSLNIALQLLDMQRWAPFAMSVFFVVTALITSTMWFALRRQAEADQLEASPVS